MIIKRRPMAYGSDAAICIDDYYFFMRLRYGTNVSP